MRVVREGGQMGKKSSRTSFGGGVDPCKGGMGGWRQVGVKGKSAHSKRPGYEKNVCGGGRRKNNEEGPPNSKNWCPGS